jgi:PAS domain S-box-containing protein
LVGGLILSERQRVDARARTRLTDTDAEEAFDRLTRIASRLIGAPVAISLVDDQRQYFKGRVDIDARQTPLSHSLCVPLISSDGQRLGSFCAADSTPREWTDAEVALLTELARSAMTEIELRMANRELAGRDTETRSIIESSHEAFLSCDREGTILAFNPAAERLFGWTEAEVLGRPVMQTLVPEDLREQVAAGFQRGDRALDGMRNELRATHRSGRELLIEASFAIADLPEGRRFHVFVRDIGELRALERHRDHLASIVKTTQDAISTIDCDGLDQFELYAQPIRGVHADGIERFELLLRLRGDDGELLTPATFLYNAERFDLIQQIDRWVFAQAAEILGACAAAGRDVSLSVNMSAKTLCDREIIADLTSVVASHPIPRDRLVVEVTETVAIVHIDRARAVSRALHGLGCGFALDDFGAGFASFYHLKHLKFDFVKIDGEFVKSVSDNTTDRLVVKSVVDLARGLGAETIAEYVEDPGSMQRLTDLGVDFAQGFHLGRPVPVAQVLPETRRSPAR